MINTKLTLNTGAHMPLLGFGTFLAPPGEVGAALKTALKVGYRHIDCAAVYKNEKEIGDTLKEVFKEGSIKRQDLFITSKLSAGLMHPNEVKQGLDKTLSDLSLEYLDLYLIHIPVGFEVVNDKSQVRRTKGFGLQDIWRKMEEMYEKGLVKAIGVSNYNAVLMHDILNYSKITPAVNQVERHPYFVQEKLVKVCQENSVAVTAYASLGATGLDRATTVSVLEDPTILEIAKTHKKTAAQVLIRWSIDTNVIAIPKSVKDIRIQENWNIWDFQLTPDEIKRINGLDRNLRSFHQDWFGFPTFV